MSTSVLPKTNVGRSTHGKTKQPYRKDITTSTDWGFVQPLFVKKMIAGSSMHVNALRSFVRVQPLSKPTFGEASWRTYHRFVPYEELFPTYPYMLKGEPYYTANGNSNYIPTQMPWIYISDLSRILLGFQSAFTIYYMDGAVYKSIGSLAEATRNNYITAVVNANKLSNGQESGLESTYHVFDDDLFVTPEGADYIQNGTLSVSGTNHSVMVCYRLSKRAKNVYKILVGCGFQLNANNLKEWCIAPLMAYYRAYFDLFHPVRDMGWSATNAFFILDYIREKGTTNIVNDDRIRVAFKNFIGQLSQCYYTTDSDFISSHLATPSVGSSSGYSNVSFNNPNNLNVVQPISSGNNNQPLMYSTALNSSGLTSTFVRGLDILTKMVNKDSQIAHRVDEWMAAHGFGKSLLDVDPYNIGSESVPIEITDIISTAETAEGSLGEFAGTAVGRKPAEQYKKYNYTTDVVGFWITLACCVPESGWFQGISPDSGCLDFRRYDEYWSELDAQGFEISTKDQVCGQDFVVDGFTAAAPEPLGFIPRYTRYKVSQNIVNGNCSLRSTRNAFLPYTLDRYITLGDISTSGVSGSGSSYQFKIASAHHTVIPVANTDYRFIGKDLWLGNYDRIFQTYDEGHESSESVSASAINLNPLPDHFVVHNFLDATYIAPVISMADSYDTDSFSNEMQVEKA